MNTTGHSWELLRGFEPVSFCDWPGYISSVLFFGGCNLRCPTCHNWSIAWTPSEVDLIDKDAVLDHIRANRRWLDGLVITGGEPTFVRRMHLVLQDLQALNLPVKMDTNGLNPLLIDTFLNEGLIRAVSVDVKGPWNLYPQLTGNKIGAEQAQIALEQIFALARQWPGIFHFRCTHVPDLSAADLDIVRSYLPSGHSLAIQQYIQPLQHTKRSTLAHA